jgi:hypothetical protein
LPLLVKSLILHILTARERKIKMIKIVKIFFHLWVFASLFFIPCLIAAKYVTRSSDSKNAVLMRITYKVNQGVAVDEKYYLVSRSLLQETLRKPY